MGQAEVPFIAMADEGKRYTYYDVGDIVNQ